MTLDKSKNPAVEISLLALKDAHKLSPLLASYTQALKRGAPRRPDNYYAEQLLQDKMSEVFGAHLNSELVGFVIFYDLPEPISGMRIGQVDHIHVQYDHQGKGIAKAMIDLLSNKAKERGWSKLIFNAPRLPKDGKKLYEQVAVKGDWTSFIIRFD